MGLRPLINCILAAAIALTVTGCYDLPQGPEDPAADLSSGTQEEVGTREQTITLPFYPESSLHPVLGSDRVNLTLSPLLYQGLFELDPFFVAQPVLCESYVVSEDGLRWTFTLKTGVAFSDGTPLTAQIAASALETARTSSRYSSRLSCVTAFGVDEDGRLTATLSRPNTGLPALLDIPVARDNGHRPAGTSRYVLAESEMSLRLRDGHPTLPQKIELQPIARQQELAGGLEPGGVLTLVDTDPTGTDAPGFSGTYHTVDYDTTALVYLGFNTGRSVFRTAHSRGALSSALDRDGLVSAAFSGHALATTIPIHPASPLYNESLARQLSSNHSARELLEQAGLAGRTVTLLVSSENTAMVTAAQLIARQLEKAGMQVKVSALGWSDYLSALSARQFDLYLAQVNLTADFDLSRLVGSGGALNYTSWSASRTDALLREFLAAPEDDRVRAAAELCDELAQQCPISPLCFKRSSVLVRSESGLSTLTPTRANVFYSWFK